MINTITVLMNRIFRLMIGLGSIAILLALAGCGAEQRAWKDAESLDNLEAYHSFMASYPDSSMRGQALERISSLEEAAWESAQAAKTVQAIEEFLSHFPDSTHRAEAEITRIEAFPTADNVSICNQGQCLSVGQIGFGIRDDLSLDEGTPSGPIRIFIWRSFAEAELESVMASGTELGKAYVYKDDGSFDYVGYVDLKLSNRELAELFGVEN